MNASCIILPKLLFPFYVAHCYLARKKLLIDQSVRSYWLTEDGKPLEDITNIVKTFSNAITNKNITPSMIRRSYVTEVNNDKKFFVLTCFNYYYYYQILKIQNPREIEEFIEMKLAPMLNTSSRMIACN